MVRAEVALAAKSRVGSRHLTEGLENEDSVYCSSDHPVFDAVLMVADGMGGHSRPKEASETAVRSARLYLWDPVRLEEGRDVDSVLRGAMQTAHAAVRRLRDGSARAPGTTFSVAVVADGSVFIAHVGDGSVYLHRDEQVQPIAGGEQHRAGNRPSQFLGQDGALEPELRQLILENGDRILLCTDGLTRYFREAGDNALAEILGRRGIETKAIAEQLTSHNRAAEYDDDTSVVLVEIVRLEEVARSNSARARAAANRTPLRIGAAAARPVAPATFPRSGAQAPVPATGGQKAAPSTPRSVSPAARAAQERSALSGPALSEGVAAHPATPLDRILRWAAPAAGGIALVLVGFWLGRVMAPRSPVAQAPAQSAAPAPAADPAPASPAALQQLPNGSLVLVDPLNQQAYSLLARGKSPIAKDLELQLLQVGKDGRMQDAGKRFRLNAETGVLLGPTGQKYPVDLVTVPGAIRIVAGGILVVPGPKGARVWVDGREVGVAPCKPLVAAGRRKVRIDGPGGSVEAEAQVPAGGKTTLGWEAP